MAGELTTKKPPFSVAIQSDMYKNLINNTLGDPKRAERFIASISSAVAINSDLKECDAGTILSGALLGESLKLSPSPQLGQFYLVPFNNNKKGVKEAQFQLGYKGYIQLAKRSGQYEDIDVIEVREGEYLGRDKATGKHKFEFIEDDDVREDLPIIGYLAYFIELNGFKKQLFWKKKKMENHALKFSQGYKADKAKGTSFTFWSKNFDDMAFKTILRQLLSKWGTLSVEMQTAYERDMTTIQTDGTFEYVDNDSEEVEVIEVQEEVKEGEVLEATQVNLNDLG